MTVAVVLIALALGSARADEYELGSGDTIRVQVFNEPQLSRETVIPTVCRIDVELIGALQVCGRTTAEVADDIERRLADGYLVSPQVVVEVADYGSQKIEVRGAVKDPGIQVLQGPTTLSQVITAAGGPNGENVVEVHHYTASGASATYVISRLHELAQPVYVDAGDVVILKQGRHVYVDGEVKKVGAVPFHEGLTVTQALSLAGGPNEYAGLRRAYVIKPNGQKITVNIKRINEGLESDLVLEPDDKLMVRTAIF